MLKSLNYPHVSSPTEVHRSMDNSKQHATPRNFPEIYYQLTGSTEGEKIKKPPQTPQKKPIWGRGRTETRTKQTYDEASCPN